MKDKHLLKLEITFFCNGALSSILFVWLVSLPATVDFWFIRGHEFLIPRTKYWLVFGALLTSALGLSYWICVFRSWLLIRGRSDRWRQVLAPLVFLMAFPSGIIIGSGFLGSLDPIFGYSLACLVIALLISAALWLFTLSWKTWLGIFLLLTIPAAYILTIILYRSLNLSNHTYSILRFTFIGALLSAICGYWLATPRNTLTND